MRLWKFSQKAWFYFRLGHGAYLNFILSFVQFVVIMYALFIARFPALEGLHLWLFAPLFLVGYGLAAIYVGRLHNRIQAFTDSLLSATQSPYVYRMVPVGKEARLNTPASLTALKIEMRRLEWMDQVSRRLNIQLPDFAEFEPELRDYKRKTETLLAGGEVR